LFWGGALEKGFGRVSRAPSFAHARPNRAQSLHRAPKVLARGKGFQTLCACAQAKTEAIRAASAAQSADFFRGLSRFKKNTTPKTTIGMKKKLKKDGTQPSMQKKNKEGKQEKKRRDNG
jgi:hypothetical protein